MTSRTTTDQDTMQGIVFHQHAGWQITSPASNDDSRWHATNGKAHVAAAKSAHNPLGRSANGMGDNAVVDANDRVARDDYDHRRGPCRGVVTVEAGYRDGVLR